MMKSILRTSIVLYSVGNTHAYLHSSLASSNLKSSTAAASKRSRQRISLEARLDDNKTNSPSRSFGSPPIINTKRDLVMRNVSSLEKEAIATDTKENDVVVNDEDARRIKAVSEFLVEKMGTVDESRIAFPEIASGEVPRMFSNISYKKEENNSGNITKSAIHASGSTLGASALVAGTTIGAGILALPTATAPAGFLPSSAALCIAWLYMTISGLLIAELSINRMGETGKQGVGLLEIYKTYLGDGLGRVGSGAYFFLHYAIMVAYISQGGSNLGSFLDTVGLASLSAVPGLDQVLFATSIGSLVYFASPSAVERMNNILVLGVVGSFLGIIGLGANSADFNSLISFGNQHPVSSGR